MTGSAARHPHPVDAHGDPLTLALSGLMAEAPGAVREYAVDGVVVDGGEDLVLAEPVTARIRLSRTNRGLVLDARVTTALAGECARCLRPLVTRVAARIDEEVLPTIDLAILKVYFPLSFLNIMVHLTTHLVKEIHTLAMCSSITCFHMRDLWAFSSRT